MNQLSDFRFVLQFVICISDMEIRILGKDELMERLQQFCDLYHCCFNDKIDEVIVSQRYLQNPLDELAMCVAIDKEKIVANYSVSPSWIVSGNVRFKCALSLNTMTHPDYIGQGLFVKLASTLYGHLQENGYAMVYGFPNYISNRTFLTKLGWKNIYEYPTLELTIESSIPFEKRNLRELDDVSVIPNIQSENLYVDKNIDYLQWRYVEKPNVEYHFLMTGNGGWCVYKRYEDMYNIVELHTESVLDVNDFVGFITAKAKQNGLKKLTVWSAINSKQHLALEKLGFRNRYPITYFGAVDLGISSSVCFDVFDHRNWLINMGDDNVY